MEDYDMACAPDAFLLLPASPIQLIECPVDPFLERLAAAGFVAAGVDFAATLDEAGTCGKVQGCLPLLPSESMEKGTAEDGNFEVVVDDDGGDVGILPGERCIWHGGTTRELPPRPPSRAGMAGDFLIFDEQEGGGGGDEGLGMGPVMGRAGGLEDEEDVYEELTKRGRAKNRDVLSENAYASPPSPTPRGPRTRARASIHKHRGRAPRKYTSAALRGGVKGTSSEVGGSQLSTFPPLQPLPPPAIAPPPSPMTPPPKVKRPRDTGGNEVPWPELDLDGYDIPSPPMTRLVSSHYAHSSSGKENKFCHHSLPIGVGVGDIDDVGDGRDRGYPDADPMDISPPPSPELPRSRASSRTLSPPPVESDSGSSIDTSSSSSSDIDTTTSSSSSSSGDTTSSGDDDNDNDNGRRVGPSTCLHHPSHSQPRASTSFTCLKYPSLRSIHSSVTASIKHDCTILIKEALLPQITSPTSTNHSSIFTTSLHFQHHLRTCFTSFTGNLTSWKLALENALHASPPKGRITLPGYLTLVPSYPHLILELNIRLNNSIAPNSTSTSKPPRPRLPTPPPQTPIYALCKLVLAELAIAAYLAEVEMYSHALVLPVQSKSADIVRQKLLRRVSREANEGVEEAHGVCTMMWRGEWGVGGEETEADEEWEGPKKRRRMTGILKEYNVALGRERERMREGRREREWREREECAREFTWWWEEERNG